MSRGMLFGAIGAVVIVVAALATLTATVIAGGDNGRPRASVRVGFGYRGGPRTPAPQGPRSQAPTAPQAPQTPPAPQGRRGPRGTQPLLPRLGPFPRGSRPALPGFGQGGTRLGGRLGAFRDCLRSQGFGGQSGGPLADPSTLGARLKACLGDLLGPS